MNRKLTAPIDTWSRSSGCLSLLVLAASGTLEEAADSIRATSRLAPELAVIERREPESWSR